MKAKINQVENHACLDQLPTLRTVIARHLFFRGLTATHLDLLAGCARQIKFPGDTLIFRQGNIANRFYLIVDGCVALEADQPGHGTIRIQTLGTGDSLGWSWLFPPHIWRFSARTMKPTRAIVFKDIQLRAQFTANPSLGNELVKRMAQVVVERLQATQTQLVQISRVAIRAQVQALQMAMPKSQSSSTRKV
jgi:CRP-like cAMP-binding protein